MRAVTYGITPRDLFALLRECSGCAICGGPTVPAPFVDHDHATGAVRGLLCMHCNFGIGHFRDDPDLLRAAIEYLAPRADGGGSAHLDVDAPILTPFVL